MKRVLIVEPDRQFATLLFQVLTDAGDYAVASVATAREASLLVGQESHDLAFIPLEEDDSLLRSLRQRQPDLRIVLISEKDPSLLEFYQGLIQGVLLRSEIQRGRVRKLLEEALAAPLIPHPPPGVGNSQGMAGSSLAVTLHGLTLNEKVLTVLISRGEHVLAHSGTLTGKQAALIARQVAAGWEVGCTGQIQFARLPSRNSDLLILTRPVVDSLLTLAAHSDAAIGPLRRQADEIAGKIVGFPGVALLNETAVEPAEAAGRNG